MLGVPGRRVDRLLQVHAGMDVAQEELRDPLVLLVAAGRAPGEVRLAVAQRHGRRERRARPLAGRERGRMALLEPEHLRARAEAEAELRDHRRGMQPAAGRRRRHHVAVAVDDVEMHRVARHRAHLLALASPARRPRRAGRPRHASTGCADRRLARPGRADRGALPSARRSLHGLAEARRSCRGGARARPDRSTSLRARVVVGVREQRLDRHVDEFRIAVERVAVREGELRALDLQMDEVRPARIEAVEVEALAAARAAAASTRPLRPRTGLAARCSGRSRRRSAPRRSPATSPCRRR